MVRLSDSSKVAAIGPWFGLAIAADLQCWVSDKRAMKRGRDREQAHVARAPHAYALLYDNGACGHGATYLRSA